MISHNIYVILFSFVLFSQVKYLFFFSFRHNLNVFKKHDFTPNFSVMLKCIFLTLRRKVNNHYILAAGVSFSKQFALFIKLWTSQNISYI